MNPIGRWALPALLCLVAGLAWAHVTQAGPRVAPPGVTPPAVYFADANLPGGFVTASSPKSVLAGEVFSLDLALDTGAHETDGIQVAISFVPALLQVVDPDTGSPAGSGSVPAAKGFVVQPTNPYTLPIALTVDNGEGRVLWSAGAPFPMSGNASQVPGGVYVLVRLYLEAVAPTAASATSLSFAGTGAAATILSPSTVAHLSMVSGAVIVRTALPVASATPTSTPTAIPSPTSTATPMPTATTTAATSPTNTATPTLAPSATPPAELLIQLRLQRSNATPPAPAYETDVAVHLYSGRSASAGRTPIATAVGRTGGSGSVRLPLSGVAAGEYDVNVKPAHALSMDAVAVAVPSSGTVVVGLGPAWEGDANDDDVVTILDFSLLASGFNRGRWDAAFDQRVDFNQDGAITILDFSLLAAGFGKAGPLR